MEMTELSRFALATLEILAFLFIFVIGTSIIIIAILYVIDRTQTKQAIRHNYPVVGRFRYFFEHLGGFFRQYFLRWTVKNYPLIEQNDLGYIVQLKTLTLPLLLALHAIFINPAQLFLVTAFSPS